MLNDLVNGFIKIGYPEEVLPLENDINIYVDCLNSPGFLAQIFNYKWITDKFPLYFLV
jgi:hypothetical protein